MKSITDIAPPNAIHSSSVTASTNSAHGNNVEINGDRVAGDNSILARGDGSFFDFNGSINYLNVEELLEAHPTLGTGSGKYTPPAHLGTNPTHDTTAVSKAAQALIAAFKPHVLKAYLPFYDYEKIRSNVGTTYDNNLAVAMWRPTNGGSKPGTHIGLCQYRGTAVKWMSIKGSDSKCCEAQVFNNGYVYSSFGMGDFLLLKSTGLNYLCFGGDGAAKNSPYAEYMQKKIGSRTIRLIADNDESGRSTAGYLRSYGFKTEVFNWKKLGDLSTPKMDLRDLANIVKSRMWNSL